MTLSYKKVRKPIKKTQTYGGALLSTIEQTSVLGKVGKSVLAKQGIGEIVVAKKYPSLIRQEIHKEIWERFGSFPLFYFGILQIEGFKGDYVTLKDNIEKFYARNRTKIHANDLKKRLIWLDKFLAKIGETSNRILQKATNDQFFNLKYSRINDFNWEVHYCHPSIITYEEPYNRGSMLHWVIKYLSQSWDFRMDIDGEKSVQGNGWSRYVWKLQFSQKNNKVDLNKVESDFIEYKQKARDKLFQCVIEDADKQREKVEGLLGQLGKYTPPQIQSALVKGKYDTRITTRRKKITIFFSDIANFTATSEGLQPEDLTNYLNEYFSEMTEIALRYGGTIDKYIGDAMMVFFGDPDSKGERQDARSCVEMALCMQERMRFLQNKWSNQGFADPFKVRMGMNTGYCNVGNFGSEQRLTYTIIGGEVNVAQRLESAASPNGVLMSYETYAHAQDMVEVEENASIKMKGINREIKAFSVIGSKLNDTGRYVDEKNKKDQEKDRAIQNQRQKTMDQRMRFLEDKLESLDTRINTYFLKIKEQTKK